MNYKLQRVLQMAHHEYKSQGKHLVYLSLQDKYPFIQLFFLQ